MPFQEWKDEGEEILYINGSERPVMKPIFTLKKKSQKENSPSTLI